MTVAALAAAITSEAQLNPHRTAVELLQCAAEQLGHPWEQETSELVACLRKPPADAVVPHQRIITRRPFLALCQAVRGQPKKDAHRHVSGNLDPHWLCRELSLDEHERKRLLEAHTQGAFAEMKRSIDGLLRNLPNYLACFTKIVLETFQDGVVWVGIRFNPSNKSFCRMGDLLAVLDQTLQPIEADLRQRTGWTHSTAFLLSINRRYGSSHAGAALAEVRQLLSDPSVPDTVKTRLAAFDLCGPELRGDDIQEWTPVFDTARQLRLTSVAHLGDSSWPECDMTAEQHIEYVRGTLRTFRPERIGHGLVLAPLVERAQGRLEDARHLQPVIRQVLADEVQAHKVAIETAPSATIFGPHRDRHRIWYWDELGVDWVPILDEQYQPQALGMGNLSTWVAVLLLLAPEHAPTPLTWSRMMQKLAPEPGFPRPRH